MADIRCPMCGHNNPEGTLNCEKCGARVVPMGSIGQSSTPPPISESELLGEVDLASLLDDIVDEGTSNDSDTGAMDSEILSWLDDDQPERKGDVPESADTPAVEDRLSNLLNDIEPPLDDRSITDWLDTAPQDKDSSEESTDEDWLSIASDDLDEDDEPDLLEDVESDNSTVEVVSSPVEPAEPMDNELSVPDWMSDTVTDVSSLLEDDTAEDEDESQLPDWMSETVTDASAYVEEETKPVEEPASPQLPDWIVDAPRATTGELDDSVLEEQEEMPEWFTQELDETAVDDETAPSTGTLKEHVSTGSLPWVSGVSDEGEKRQDEPISAPEEDPVEEPKKQIFDTEGLDTSPVEEPPRESLKPDDELPPSTGVLDGERVSTGALPWMDGVSDPKDEIQNTDFELPVNEKEVDKKKTSGLLKKVTTSMLPWMSGVSADEDKPKTEEPEEPRQSTTILERFSGLLGRKGPKPAPEPVVEEPVIEQTPVVSEPVEEPMVSEPVLETSFEEEETQATSESVPELPEEEPMVSEPEKFEPVSSLDDDVPLPEPVIPTLDISIQEEHPAVEDDAPVSIEDLVKEEQIQTIAPQPKENYEDALPEKEEGAESWSEFLDSDEFSPAGDELPGWFAQTSTGKSSSDLLKEIGADENPTPVPVEEEPKEEKPKKKRGLTLGFLKGIRRRTDENLANKDIDAAETLADEQAEKVEEAPVAVDSEASVSLDDAMKDISDDWDLSKVLTDSKPLSETTEEEEEASEEIAKQDWVIEEASDDEAHLGVETDDFFIDSLDESEEEVGLDESIEEPAEKPRQSLIDKTAGLASGTDMLEEPELEPEDESLIGFAGTSTLPSWMVGSGKQSGETNELLDAALDEDDTEIEAVEDEESTMTVGLPGWMNTGRLDGSKDLPFEVNDQLMDSIQDAMPTSELPEWLEEAETPMEEISEEEPGVIEPAVSEPEVVEEPSLEQVIEEADEIEEDGTAILPDWMDDAVAEMPAEETKEQEIEDDGTAVLPDWMDSMSTEETSVEEPEIFTSMFSADAVEAAIGADDEEEEQDEEVDLDAFFDGIESDESEEAEESTIEELVDDFFETAEEEIPVEPVIAESEEVEADQTVDEISGALVEVGLPEWLDDDVGVDEDLQTEADTADGEEGPKSQGLPKFMDDDMEFVEIQAEEALENDEIESSEVDHIDDEIIETAILPDWMSESDEAEPAEEETVAEIPTEDDGTAILPDWMDETSVDAVVIESVEETVDEVEDDADVLPDWLEENPAEESEVEPIVDEESAEIDDEAAAFIDGLIAGDEPSDVVEDVPVEVEDESSEMALPDWMSDLAEDDEVLSEAPEEEDAVKAGTSALEEWMDDPSATHGLTGMLLDGLETGTLPPLDEDAVEESAAALPDWMPDLTESDAATPESIEEESEIDLSEMFDEEPAGEEVVAADLPDWMSELSEDEETPAEPAPESLDEKPGTSALEEWMDDPSATHGLTGMLLDGLETGTLPPLEGIEEESETEVEPEAELPDWMEDPESSRGQTGMLLDSLETGTLPPLDDFVPSEAVEADDLPDWLSEMEIEPIDGGDEDSFLDELQTASDALSDADEITSQDSPTEASTVSLEDVAATVPLGDIAATQALPDWMSEMTIDGEDDTVAEEAEEAEMGDLPVELADFITSGEELPEWINEVAAEEPAETEEEEPFESAFDTDAEVMSQDPTAMLPDWVDDMESAHGQTGMLLDNLETEDTQALKVPGSDSNLPDWLSEYGDDDGDNRSSASQADLEAWLVSQDEESEAEPAEDFNLEPVTTTDTGELNQWISENGISPEASEDGEVEIEDVMPIEVQKDLPDWVLDLEPDETAPMSPEAIVASGTAALPEWVVSDEEPEIDMSEEEIPPMEAGLFDFMADEESGEETQPVSAEEESEFTEEMDAFDIASFRSNVSSDSLFGEPESDDGEEVTPEDLFHASGADFDSDEDLSQGGEEVSPFDISQLEDVEDNYTPAMELADQSEWLGEYADEEEDLFEEAAESTNPFNISLDEAEEADAEGVAVAEELPEWVDEIEASEDTEAIWETPLAAMAAISSSVQTTFDEEQPEVDRERAHVQLMERILLSEKGSVQTSRPRRRTRELTLRLMLTLLVFVAVLAGLYSMVPPRSDFVNNAPAAVVKFDQAVDYFQANLSDKPVLVVFDYQPAYHEEISVYAELPLKTLMANDARIFTFSTVPEGPALGQKMLFDVVMRNGLQYNTQDQAVPLGYLPGGSNAIRDFSTRMRSTVHGLDVGTSGTYVWDLPMVKDVYNIDDFAMVLVLTDDLDKARLWIEQSTLYLPDSTNLLMVTSARISPMLRPYLLSEQLDGLIGSAVDAAAYGNPELSNQIGNYLFYWRAYQLGIYLMVATIIAGALLQIMRQLQRAFKRGNS